MTQSAFQDLMPGNYCWGCGSLNPQGLYIKSYWDGDQSVCVWQPDGRFMAGPTHVLNGGIIATLIDCHSICTAIADAYRVEGREIGEGERIWYATGSIQVSYKKPTPIDQEVMLTARITESTGRRTNLTCSLSSGGEECATGEVVTVRVPLAWLEAN